MAKNDDALKGLVTQLKARVSSVENQLANQGKELNAARKEAAKASGLKDEIKDLEAKLEAAEKAGDRLEAENQSLSAREAIVAQDLSDLEALRRLVK